MVSVGDVVRLTDIGWDWVGACNPAVARRELFVVTNTIPTTRGCAVEGARIIDPDDRWELFHDEIEPCDIKQGI